MSDEHSDRLQTDASRPREGLAEAARYALTKRYTRI
jgi:hypothetical protein